MTIHCPACETAFRLPPAGELGAATFRCSRCDHVFRLDPPPETSPPPARRAIDDEPADAPDAPAPPDDEDREDDESTPRRGAPTARFAFRALAGMTLAFGLLSIYAYMHRGRVAELLAAIPLVGPELTVTRLRPAHIQLTDVRGEYARAGGDALVFVITGSAVNNAPEPVSAIQIKGSIVGGTEQHRLVYAGAAPHDVHDLSTREIDLLQTLEPPRDWRLLPGEDGDFLVAFVDPPQPLQEFRVEVAAVQRRRPIPRDD
jgi:predicted Zn finger-like uncharacterized protein